MLIAFATSSDSFTKILGISLKLNTPYEPTVIHIDICISCADLRGSGQCVRCGSGRGLEWAAERGICDSA